MKTKPNPPNMSQVVQIPSCSLLQMLLKELPRERTEIDFTTTGN